MNLHLDWSIVLAVVIGNYIGVTIAVLITKATEIAGKKPKP